MSALPRRPYKREPIWAKDNMSTFADLLFRTADGVFAVDAKQRTVLWNAGCAQLFGIPSSAALGRPCNEIVRGRDTGGQALCNGQCCVVRLLQGEGVPPKGFPLRALDSAGRALVLSVNLVLVPSQRLQSWTCVHLLYRGDAPDVLETFGDTLKRRLPCTPADAHALPLAALALSSLTERERQLLQLLAEGLATPMIAQRLRIHLATARNHLQHIQAKLGVHSQAEAVAYAYRHNLVFTGDAGHAAVAAAS